MQPTGATAARQRASLYFKRVLPAKVRVTSAPASAAGVSGHAMSVPHGTTYTFPIPAAARFASLAGIRSDLQQVITYCDRMIERYAGPHLKKTLFDIVGFTTPLDFVDWEALSTAACISYARCFSSGVRQSLDSDLLNTADIELKTLHNFVVNFRDKHIAHSVNSFEENLVTVHIGEYFQSSQEIETVAASHTQATGLSIEVPAKLKGLAQWWLAKVDEEMTVERAKLLRIARDTPLSELKAHGVPLSSSPTDRTGNVRKRRSSP